MEKIINQLLDNVVEIMPIGHHQLKRHLVYRVRTVEQDFVIKFYFVKNRFESEVKSLELLRDSQVPVPQLTKFGTIQGHDYILYPYEKGVTLDKVIHQLDSDNIEALFEQAGIYLKMIHSFGFDEPYGRLAVQAFDTFSEALDYDIMRIYHNLGNYEHPSESVIESGKEALERAKKDLGDPDKGLCHMDYGSRNILVNKVNDRYEIVKIIDFEQGVITDLKRDFVNVYQKFTKNERYLKAFSKGYGEDILKHIRSSQTRVYHLHYGLSICSWSLPVDRIHYQEGVEILKEYSND